MNRPRLHPPPPRGAAGILPANALIHVGLGLERCFLNNEIAYLGVKGLPRSGEMRY